MDPERWRQIEELFHAALERTPEVRPVFLDGACRGDVDLRREVESLLAREPQAGSFLEAPALEDLAPSPILVGRQVGPYRILSPLGAGGMGEVYRAHDIKLGRDVALKTLPSEFARDPDRLARFRREARALATLNHPNIAAIYGLEESTHADCLVLELVEGETLAERIRRTGPLPLAQALDYARQIAEALEAAHCRGIIHRDLKPANVKVTPEGRVKVLDFGLAKAVWGIEEGQALTKLATATFSGTLAGHIVGTPGYMSPEQACAREVDQRTDIWAYGCLLFEMLSGKQAFNGETLADIYRCCASERTCLAGSACENPVENPGAIKAESAERREPAPAAHRRSAPGDRGGDRPCQNGEALAMDRCGCHRASNYRHCRCVASPSRARSRPLGMGSAHEPAGCS
jgi:serine/threonine protein kinase